MEEQAEGKVVAVCLGPGGIPKAQVDTAEVGELGLAGDGHLYKRHGGPNRAVCLLSEEAYESLRGDGVDCSAPGTFGENLLTEGLRDDLLQPGDTLAVGDEVVVEIHDIRAPCAKLKSVDARFPDLMLGRSGWVCRVVRGGTVRPGMTIRMVPSQDRS